jgi:hypothetical protein
MNNSLRNLCGTMNFAYTVTAGASFLDLCTNAEPRFRSPGSHMVGPVAGDFIGAIHGIIPNLVPVARSFLSIACASQPDIQLLPPDLTRVAVTTRKDRHLLPVPAR